MTTIRVEHSKDYTVIANEAIRDKSLSFGARGLHHLLLSYPDGWSVKIRHLINESEKDGKQKIMGQLRELEERGYLTRERRKDYKTGKFQWESVIRERALLPCSENPEHGNPEHGKPESGFPEQLISTNSESTKSRSTDLTSTQEKTDKATSGSQRGDEFERGVSPGKKSQGKKLTGDKDTASSASATDEVKKKPSESHTSSRDQREPITNGQDSDEGECSAPQNFSIKKIGNQLYEIDSDGMIRLPPDPSNKLARALTVRTLQFLIWKEWSEQDFLLAQAPDGDVYVFDPRNCVWEPEDQMMSVRQMVCMANSETEGVCTDLPYIDIGWLNSETVRWFETWQKWTRETPNAAKIVKSRSVAQMIGIDLEQLTWDDLGYEDDDDAA